MRGRSNHVDATKVILALVAVLATAFGILSKLSAPKPAPVDNGNGHVKATLTTVGHDVSVMRQERHDFLLQHREHLDQLMNMVRQTKDEVHKLRGNVRSLAEAVRLTDPTFKRQVLDAVIRETES